MGGGSYTETFSLTQQEYAVRKKVVADGETSVTINDTVKTITSSHDFTCSLTTYLGNVHRASGSYPAYMTCYKSKWYENGTTLSRWYIPVRRLSDNVGGMYDVVNNTFNPSMTGVDFVKGADL